MPVILVGDADDQRPSARQFRVWNFCCELQAQAQAGAFLLGGIVEEIDYVASKSIFQSASLIEIERAGRIDFQILHSAHDGAQLALELQSSFALLAPW